MEKISEISEILKDFGHYINNKVSVIENMFNELIKEVKTHENIIIEYEEEINNLEKQNDQKHEEIKKLNKDLQDKENKIQSGIHYTSLHNHDVYKINDDILPNSENESLTTLSIPFHEKLTNSDIEKIIKIING